MFLLHLTQKRVYFGLRLSAQHSSKLECKGTYVASVVNDLVDELLFIAEVSHLGGVFL